MKIIIDCEVDPFGGPVNFQFLDTDKMLVDESVNPSDPNAKVKVTDFLAHLNANPDKRDKGGWSMASKLPGLPDGTTRWQALVNTVNRADAPDELKQLQLK